MPNKSREERAIKCVVWDLDNTIWRGILLEGDRLVPRPEVRATILELDRRGILQSIASKNDHAAAWQALTELGLSEYFICPQINWGEKSSSIRAIVERIGIAPQALAFVDDQAFERDEVRFHLPEVQTIDAADVERMLEMKELQPRFVTPEAGMRRQMYQADERRKRDEEAFDGQRREFLAALSMVMTIRSASAQDLPRAEELTIRTNQLNTTGRTYSEQELLALVDSRNHWLLVSELEDRYGAAGTIGLALVELRPDSWLVKLLIASCRVLSRGVGGILLTHILQEAKRSGVRLFSEFVMNDRNRAMYVTYKFHGFVEVSEQEGVIVLEHSLDNIRPIPPFVTMRLPGRERTSLPSAAELPSGCGSEKVSAHPSERIWTAPERLQQSRSDSRPVASDNAE
jgi:FkbH-like protein